MVNTGMVNAQGTCSEYAHFCKIFAVSGRIPRLQNPFKYTRRFDLNHKTVHSALGVVRYNKQCLCVINDLCCP
jgi:hypothetical protein